MPLLPIDLQTMFSQMNQVGKEQAVQKDGLVQTQLARDADTVKKTEHDDNAVNQTHNVGEGLEKIKDEKEKRREAKEGREEKKEKEEHKKDKAVFEDPYLGHHINIVG